jgi:hypothetical protein
VEQLAVSVSILLPVAGFALNDAVRPLGRLGALRVTLPVNPACGVTVKVSVTEAPWDSVNVEEAALRVKLGAGLTLTQTVPAIVCPPEAP